MTGATTPYTNRQWSDEVAAEDEERKASSIIRPKDAQPQFQATQDQPKQANPSSKKLEKHKAFTQAVDRALSGDNRRQEDADESKSRKCSPWFCHPLKTDMLPETDSEA